MDHIWLLHILLLLLTLTGSPQTGQAGASGPPAALSPDTLMQARRMYNAQQFEDAIRLAAEARRTPAIADAATVVFARAHLERYRQMSEQGDLDAARDALTAVDDGKLSPRDHLELIIGLGESLYFDAHFSAAAEFFEIALAHPASLEPNVPAALFEWWANALSQQAELGAESERKPLYARILQRADEELRRDDRSAVASYWLAAASRGTNDLDRAWGAALAGWVRAPLTGAGGAALRADLDRLVTLVLVPERAVRLSSTGDPRAAAAILLQQWEELKRKYKN